MDTPKTELFRPVEALSKRAAVPRSTRALAVELASRCVALAGQVERQGLRLAPWLAVAKVLKQDTALLQTLVIIMVLVYDQHLPQLEQGRGLETDLSPSLEPKIQVGRAQAPRGAGSHVGGALAIRADRHSGPSEREVLLGIGLATNILPAMVARRLCGTESADAGAAVQSAAEAEAVLQAGDGPGRVLPVEPGPVQTAMQRTMMTANKAARRPATMAVYRGSDGQPGPG